MEVTIDKNEVSTIKFYKYPMKDDLDYRPSFNNHEVKLINKIDGVNWAIGKFSTIESDMVVLTESEYADLLDKKYLDEDKIVPNISLRQCRELLLITGRFDDVENILNSMPENTPEEVSIKRILKNYWEHSTEFERDHKYMSLITNALGMSEDEVDDFFITAHAL